MFAQHSTQPCLPVFVQASFSTSEKLRNPFNETHLSGSIKPCMEGLYFCCSLCFPQAASPKDTIQLIWQSTENQTASQYTKEMKATGRSIERLFIHYSCPLQPKETGGKLEEQQIEDRLGMNNGEESEALREKGGMEWDISLFNKLCLCALPSKSARLYISKKNRRGNDWSHQTKARLYWTLCLDRLFVLVSWAVFNLQDIFCSSQLFWAKRRQDRICVRTL